VLTGAGISKESGLSTFRDPDGIWARYDVEDVATPGAFQRNPDLVREFYNARRRQILSPEVQPNPAHHALARLEREWPEEVLVVTQNVDNLHERAGSRNLIHMHGELCKVRCSDTGTVYPWEREIAREERCACCGSTGTLRPHVVWFGEMPLEIPRILEALGQCDLFLAVGTSGHVYPAAGFAAEARWRGRTHTVELNLEPTEVSSIFDERMEGPASVVVPAYVDKLLT
jgi:NAD-dependent deacetylase